MNLRQIEAFRTVMIAGSVTGASEALAISQPAVSRLIADLEYSLGFDLFDRRRGHALQPTEEAEALYREVDKAFVSLDHLMKAGRDIQSLRRGYLRVVGPPFVSNGLLTEAAATFLDAFPDVSVSIEARPHNEVVEMIALRQQDVGVAVLPVKHPAIDVQRLADYRAVCVVAEGSPLAGQRSIRLESLESEALISATTGTQIHLMTEHAFRQCGIRPRIRVDARTQEAACYMVAQEKGVAILSEPLPAHIRDYPGTVIKPISPALPVSLGILTSNLRAPSRRVREFVNAVRAIGARA